MRKTIRTILATAAASLFIVTSMPTASTAEVVETSETSASIRVLESIHQSYLASLRSESVKANGFSSKIEISEGQASEWLTRVDAKDVNIVTNRLVTADQMKVSVEGSDYYVINKYYESTLKKNLTLRSATDPYTGKHVNKAEAVIYVDASGRAFYFESNESFDGFLALADTDGMQKKLALLK